VIIQSKLLSDFSTIRHGISTRLDGVSPELYGMQPAVGLAGNLSFSVGDGEKNVLENRKRFFGTLSIPLDRTAKPTQVHGEVVRKVSKPGEYESCDALITNKKNLFLVVTVADCLPILLYDPVTASIGVVHAGWRGSEMKILSKTVQVLSTEYGVLSKNLLVYIGPSAGVCCYEVGEEVAEKFDMKYLDKTKGAKPHLDLKRFNKDLLVKAGLPESNIEVSPDCTICKPELYHSYRHEKEKSGRMMGVIGVV
jgi:YfiH family protein